MRLRAQRASGGKPEAPPKQCVKVIDPPEEGSRRLKIHAGYDLNASTIFGSVYSQIAYPKQKSSPLTEGRDNIVVALATLAANMNSISTYKTNLRMTGPTSAYR